MEKRARHFAIRDILNSHDIRTQDDLRRSLERRGVRVTQATLSRDMKELGVMHTVSNGSSRYRLNPRAAAAESQILRPIVGAEVLSIQANESVIVVHTLPACANTVGEFIDVQSNPDIIGTVAGDNTLLVVPSSTRKTQQVARFLKDKLIRGSQ